MAQSVALTMLGGFDLRCGGERLSLPPSAERVMAYVALHDGPASRANVAGTLWLDVPEDRAMANLRSALWRLRRPGVPLIRAIGMQLELAPDVTVDLREVSAAAHTLLDGVETDGQAHLERLAFGGELLSDWYEDWVLVEREHFRQIRLQALEQLAIGFAAAGRYGRAAETALAAIATEPLRESAHRALISVHLAQGNRSEAIRQYGIYRRLMRDELGIEPSSQMEELIGIISSDVVSRAMSAMTRQ